jgi:spermidine synthase
MAKQYQDSKALAKGSVAVLSTLFFLSGVTGLILQVVWMYRLGLVFGNASYATAATLAAFFLGIAIGGWFWGNASARFQKPLRVYGFMEIGIAVTAMIWIVGIEYYQSHYAAIVTFVSGNRSLLTLTKFIFSTTLLLLPTLLMGGTFPMLAQYIGKSGGNFARRSTLLYAFNTLGASFGAFLAGFYLLKTFGVSATYTFAISLAIAIGLAAIILDWSSVKEDSKSEVSKNNDKPIGSDQLSSMKLSFELSYNHFILLAFASGLLALAAETLWTRMFAQVLQNSVYSFSAILVVFLIALGVGGLLSHLLVKKSWSPVLVLVTLLTASAILVGLSPFVFNASTNGLNYLASGASWLAYLKLVFGLSFLVVFPPTVVLGAVFPYLLKAAPTNNQQPGKFVGRLVLFNSVGGVIGPIIAGFLLLDAIGLWSSIKLIAVVYGVVAIVIAVSFYDEKKLRWLALPVVVILAVITLSNPPLVRLAPNQKILDMWQSSDGVLSVVEANKNIQMRLDNFYVLGDSRSILVEQMQAHIPLLIHSAPKKTLFLGMGTGITAGAALSHQVDRVVVIELVANVVSAAKRYFSPWANGLFEDSRVEIITDDARNFLLGTNEYFDVIVGDLFTPWHAGTGSLYTVEHFRQGKRRLAAGGIFAQWLPLYQLTPESFEVIAATFASVFPQVTVWRADFSATGASIVLIGQEKGAQLSEDGLQRNIVNVVGERDSLATGQAEHMAGLFYLGNLNAIKDRLASVTINTDDRRTVEFESPILSQQVSSGRETFISGKELENLITALANGLPAEKDPYLANLPAHEVRYVQVGLLYFGYQQLILAGDNKNADILLGQIRLIAPDFLKQPEEPQNE